MLIVNLKIYYVNFAAPLIWLFLITRTLTAMSIHFTFRLTSVVRLFKKPTVCCKQFLSLSALSRALRCHHRLQTWMCMQSPVWTGNVALWDQSGMQLFSVSKSIELKEQWIKVLRWVRKFSSQLFANIWVQAWIALDHFLHSQTLHTHIHRHTKKSFFVLSSQQVLNNTFFIFVVKYLSVQAGV